MNKIEATAAIAVGLGAGFLSAAPPSAEAQLTEYTLPSSSAQIPNGMAIVEGGLFLFGSTPDERQIAEQLCTEEGLPCVAADFLDEDPQQQIETESFLLDKHEVTNEEFDRYATTNGVTTLAETNGRSIVWDQGSKRFVDIQGANWRHPKGPSSNLTGRERHPVAHVTLDELAAYCESNGKRLPTEEEWEKAARGKNGAIFPWGNSLVFEERANWAGLAIGDTVPVGIFDGGDTHDGVSDLAGNVMEWVSGNGDTRRGGNYASRKVYQRGAWHPTKADRNDTRSTVGGRCAMDIKPLKNFLPRLDR